VQQQGPSPLLAAVGAEIGAITGAFLGLFAGWAFGSVVGLPRYRLGNDPEGFDTLGAALVGSVIGWLCGTLLGSRLATRRRAQPRRRAEAIALACMAGLALGATLVGSATADWYYPAVAFGAAPFAMAMATALDAR